MRTIQIVFAMLCAVVLAGTAIGDTAADKQQKCKFEKTITKTVRGGYLLYLPQDYGKDKAQRWPLVIYLHGSGEVGDDLEKVKPYGPPQMVEQGRQFPFILVSPQCPEDSWWGNETDMLDGMLDQLEQKYAVDKSRIYLTGQSMGGYGTWAWAAEDPKRFAAIAPVSGGCSKKQALALKDVPMWVFHGDQDTAVSFKEAKEMVEVIKAAGGNPKFTAHEGVGHEPKAIDLSYGNEEFWKWLLEQKNVNVR